MKAIGMVLMVCMLAACKLDADKKVDKKHFTFRTGDDTEIFFKNMRQSYYDLEENKAAKFNVFRFSDRIETEDHPVINLAIIINYLNDEAYLLVEPNGWMEGLEQIIIIDQNTEGTQKTISLQEFNRGAMLNFISDIYDGLLNKDTFYLEKEGEKYPILQAHQEREAFRITVSDYYRLTRVY